MTARRKPRASSRPRLGEILLRRGALSEPDLRRGLEAQPGRYGGWPLGLVLTAEGLALDTAVVAALAEQEGTRAADPVRETLDPALRGLVPNPFLAAWCVPLVRDGQGLLVAAGLEAGRRHLEFLAACLGENLTLARATRADLDRWTFERWGIGAAEAGQRRLALYKLVPALRVTGGPAAPEPERQNLVGSSPATVRLRAKIPDLAASMETLLLVGPPGCGKEVLARAVHSEGLGRLGLPFVVVDCTTLVETLAESELFGHELGAFTDATRSREGRIGAAGAGTVFLDEIGELPLALQGKLLRLLQQRTFSRVGADHERHAEARFIAATNRNLAQLAREGRFRQDLLGRLKVLVERIPPLDQRREDIGPLVLYLARRLAREHGGRVPLVEPGFVRKLESLSWPGNVRDLENLMLRLWVYGRPERLRAGLLTPEILEPALEWGGDGRRPAASPRAEVAGRHKRAKRELAREALAREGGNKTRAARRLKVARSTLLRWLGEL